MNAAGTLFVVAEVQTDSATIVSASTGKAVAEIDGGRTDLLLDAAAYDATTDTVIVSDGNNNGSIYGKSLNNSLLWTITPPSDNAGIVAFSVDLQGRSLYVFMVAYTRDEFRNSLRFVQYDLTTHTEVGRYDIVNDTMRPGLPFSAGPVDCELYVANVIDGSVARLSMKNGAEQSTYFSRYPYLLALSSVASLDGRTFTAYTNDPYMLFTYSAEGVEHRRTMIAPQHRVQ